MARAWRAAAWELAREATQLQWLELRFDIPTTGGKASAVVGVPPPLLVTAAHYLDLSLTFKEYGTGSCVWGDFDAPRTQSAMQRVLRAATALCALKADVPLELLADLDGCVMVQAAPRAALAVLSFGVFHG